MEITRVGSQPSGNGSQDGFTGTVRIDPLFQAPDPAAVTGSHGRLNLVLGLDGRRASRIVAQYPGKGKHQT